MVSILGYKNMKDRKFFVFAFDGFEAGGGMNDWMKTFDTVEEAQAYIKNDLNLESMKFSGQPDAIWNFDSYQVAWIDQNGDINYNNVDQRKL